MSGLLTHPMPSVTAVRLWSRDSTSKAGQRLSSFSWRDGANGLTLQWDVAYCLCRKEVLLIQSPAERGAAGRDPAHGEATDADLRGSADLCSPRRKALTPR